MNGDSDQRIEIALGILLRAGVMLAATVVLAGAIYFLVQSPSARPSYGVFREEAEQLRSMRAIVANAGSRRARAVIQLGVLLLIGTPVMRVIASACAFAWRRDWLYTTITLIVLAVLGYSLSFAW